MKIIPFITYCAICGRQTTKKNKFSENKIYLCDECNELHDMDKAFKIKEVIDEQEELFKKFDELLNKFYKQDD